MVVLSRMRLLASPNSKYATRCFNDLYSGASKPSLRPNTAALWYYHDAGRRQYVKPTLARRSQSKYPSNRELKTLTGETELHSRIAVIGAGSVGSTIAYTLLTNPIAGEVLIVDPKEEVRDAQVEDLADVSYHGNTSTLVRAGTHKEAGQCDIIIMTAGAAQKKGESRTDLIGRNQAILSSVIEDMKPFKETTIVLVVTNPVDVLTHFALQYSGLPKEQVIGSGTFLDSARLRGALASKAGVSAGSINAFVLGEHGESQLAAWSSANISGVPLDTFPETKEIDRDAMAKEVKQKAAAILEAKGTTAFGIASVASSICLSILFDQKNVGPVSHYQEDLEVCLSRLAVLGRKGIVKTIDLPLSQEENKALTDSAEQMKEVLKEAEKSK